MEITSRNGEEITYKIDAYSGAVIAVKREAADDDKASEEQPANPAQPGTAQDIGHAKATSIALNHAGVDANTVYDMNTELDVENGTIVTKSSSSLVIWSTTMKLTQPPAQSSGMRRS